MTQNTIFKGSTNPVVIEFIGVDLTLFTVVTAKFGNDERDSINNPASVTVNSATELELNFQDTAETLSNYWCIKGDDELLTSKCRQNLTKTPVCEDC